MTVGFYQLKAKYPEACEKLLKAHYKSHMVRDPGIYARFGDVMHETACLIKRVSEVDEPNSHLLAYTIFVVLVKHPDIITSVNFFVEFQFAQKSHSMFEHAQRIEELDIEFAEQLIARVYDVVKTQ
jgi:hypothetical protein